MAIYTDGLRSARWWLGVLATVAVFLADGRVWAQTACVGDCNENGFVVVNELIIGVNIALDRADLLSCPSFDTNSSDTVEVNELVTGVKNALEGCPVIEASPTPSNTVEPTETAPATATATETASATPTETAPVATATAPLATATATLTVTAGSATPTGTVEEATPTVTVGTATPTGTAEEATPTVTVGTSTPTGTAEEATPTPTLTMVVSTATPTGTVIEGTPTPTSTATPVPIIEVVAGVSTVVGNGGTAIPHMIASIVNAIHLSGGVAPTGVGSAAGVVPENCPVGGTFTSSGNVMVGLMMTFADCEVMRPGGGSTVFDGMVTLQVTPGAGDTGTGTATVNVVITFKDAAQVTKLVTTANLTIGLTVTLSDTEVGSCSFDVLGEEKVIGSLDMALNGTLSSGLLGTSEASVMFMDTMVDLMINTYRSDCVPSDYVMVLDGAAQMGGTAGGGAGGASGDPEISFDVSFEDFSVNGEVTGDMTNVTLSGKITAICFGGTAILSTPEALELVLGQFCPEDGTIAIQGDGQILYFSGVGGHFVGIDKNSNGTADDTLPCLHPTLVACVG